MKMSQKKDSLKNDSDSPSSEKTAAKKNIGRITKIEQKLLKTN